MSKQGVAGLILIRLCLKGNGLSFIFLNISTNQTISVIRFMTWFEILLNFKYPYFRSFSRTYSTESEEGQFKFDRLNLGRRSSVSSLGSNSEQSPLAPLPPPTRSGDSRGLHVAMYGIKDDINSRAKKQFEQQFETEIENEIYNETLKALTEIAKPNMSEHRFTSDDVDFMQPRAIGYHEKPRVSMPDFGYFLPLEGDLLTALAMFRFYFSQLLTLDSNFISSKNLSERFQSDRGSQSG